jgi:hypothetical protein
MLAGCPSWFPVRTRSHLHNSSFTLFAPQRGVWFSVRLLQAALRCCGARLKRVLWISSRTMGGLFSKSPPAVQTDCVHNEQRITKTHSALSAQLQTRGLDEDAIRSAALSFANGQPGFYANSPWSLPPKAVRVIALPIDDVTLNDKSGRAMSRVALQAAAALGAALAIGTGYWIPPAGTLHTTILHPGISPTARTYKRQLAVEARRALNLMKPGLTLAPLAVELERELRTAQQLAAGIPANLSLVAERLALTSEGVLLLLLRPAVDSPAACVPSLRAAASAAFPRAARKQTSGLIHVSLLRIWSLPPAERGGRQAPLSSHGGAYGYGPNSTAVRTARQVVDAWTPRVRGIRAEIRGLLYVRETQIMTLKGEWHRLAFGSANAPTRSLRRGLRSLAETLAEGGTRPGYDHDRDHG